MNKTQKPEEPHVAGKDEKPSLTRRRFFRGLAKGALGAAALGAAAVGINHLDPGLLFDPPPRFHAGAPGEYAVNSVTFFAYQRVYLVRTAQGFYAESAICTHQQCTVRWNAEKNLMMCPCHGSRYKRDGEVVHGPAPRPLPHFAVELLPDGKLQVDKTRIVKLDVLLKV